MNCYGGKEFAVSFRTVRAEMLLSPEVPETHHRRQLMVLPCMPGLVRHLTPQFQDRMAQDQQAQR